MAEKIIKKTITPSEQGMLDRTKAPPGKLEGLFSSNEIKKYNQCHGPNGRFCSGGGGGGGGGGSYEPMNIPQGGLQTGAQVKPATSVDEALGKPKSEHLEDILSDSEKKAFAIYNGPDYQMINNYLRFPEYRRPENEEWAPVIARMDAAYAKAPAMQYSAVVYRGLDYNNVPEFKGKSAKDLVGAKITDKGFMSTSHDRDLADRWGNTVMTIRVPKGTKAIEMQDLIDSPRVRNEKELLLNRGTQLKITHVREEKGFLGRVSKRYIDALVVNE